MKWSLKWQIHLTLNLSHVIRNLILAKLWKIMACLHVWKLWFEERTNCHERYSWILKMKPAYQNSINGMNLLWNVVVDNMTRNQLQNTPILKDSFLFVHEFFINIDDNIIILNSVKRMYRWKNYNNKKYHLSLFLQTKGFIWANI